MRMRDIEAVARAQFPELHNGGDLATNLQALLKINPAKAQQLVPIIQQYAFYQNQAWQAHQAGQRETEQRQLLVDHINQQDNLAGEQIPELAQGGKVASEFRQATRDTIRELGIEKDLEAAYAAGQLTAPIQKAIAELVRARQQTALRASLNEKKWRPPPPPVVRPGPRYDGPSVDEAEIARTINDLPNMSQRNALRAAANVQARLRAANRPRNPNGTWM